MFAFITDWGNGEKLMLLILIFPALYVVGGIRQLRDKGPLMLAAGLSMSVSLLFGVSVAESHRREDHQVREVLSAYDWTVLDGHLHGRTAVQIGDDCVVQLRVERIDGQRSLFAIGQQSVAKPLEVIHEEAISQCTG